MFCHLRNRTFFLRETLFRRGDLDSTPSCLPEKMQRIGCSVPVRFCPEWNWQMSVSLSLLSSGLIHSSSPLPQNAVYITRGHKRTALVFGLFLTGHAHCISEQNIFVSHAVVYFLLAIYLSNAGLTDKGTSIFLHITSKTVAVNLKA